MPLRLSIYPDVELCIIRCHGAVTLADIEDYLAETVQKGVKRFGKLIDLSVAWLELSCDEFEDVAQGLVRYGSDANAGPVAMVVSTALTLDMAVLLKQRVGDRPFRIFTSVDAASAWLNSYRESRRVQDTLPRAYRQRAAPKPLPSLQTRSDRQR